MNRQESINRLSSDIRRIYRSDPAQADALIEGYLEKGLKNVPADKRSGLIDDLMEGFKSDPAPMSQHSDVDEEVLSKVFSLILGREVSQADLSSTEVLSRLAKSINTIFDTLNQVIKVINSTLFAEDSGDKTIRYMIGSQVEGKGPTQSLEGYLGQIQKAFLTTQQAFKNAAYARVKEILDELDPEKITAKGGSALKFGALRKAEFFEMYEGKFQTCKKWFESGRFMDAFLREFEKNCRKLSQ